MGEGIGARLAELRAWRRLSLREVAAQSGVSYPDLVRLESDGRRSTPPDLVRKLADLFHTTPGFLMVGEDPAPAAIRGCFIQHYDKLSAQARDGLKFATIQERIQAILTFLEAAFPGCLSRDRMAARLGYTPDALEAVLQSQAPLQSHLLRLLAAQTGLPQDFLIRGDFFGGAAPVDTLLSPTRLSEYYEAVTAAAAAGISPQMLKQAIALMTIRDSAQ